MGGVYLHSPYTPSWHGAHLKHRDNFTFIFYELENARENTERIIIREFMLVLIFNF
jgi:hypothetical protein